MTYFPKSHDGANGLAGLVQKDKRAVRLVLPVDWIVSREPVPKEFAIKKELLDARLYDHFFDVKSRNQANGP